MINNWHFWRLILNDGNFSYSNYDGVMNNMTLDDVLEANAAIDIYQAELKKQRKNK